MDSARGYRDRVDFYRDLWKHPERIQKIMTDLDTLTQLSAQRHIEKQIQSQLSSGQRVNIQLGRFNDKTQSFDQVRVWSDKAAVLLDDSPGTIRTSAVGQPLDHGMPQGFQTCSATSPPKPITSVSLSQGASSPQTVDVEGAGNTIEQPLRSSAQYENAKPSELASPDILPNIPRPADISPDSQETAVVPEESLRVIELRAGLHDDELVDKKHEAEKDLNKNQTPP